MQRIVFFVQEGGKGDDVGRIETDEADSYFLSRESCCRGDQDQEKAGEKEHHEFLGQSRGWEKAFLYSCRMLRIRDFQAGLSE